MFRYEEGFDGGSPPPLDIDGDDEDPALKATRLRMEQQRKKRSGEEGAKKKKLVGKLVPVQLGPHWEHDLGTVVQPLFASHRIQFINGEQTEGPVCSYWLATLTEISSSFFQTGPPGWTL